MTSRAPIDQIEALRRRMAWDFPFVHASDRFRADMGITTGYALDVFIREDERVFKSYSTTGRGVETLGTVWTLLDLTPLGRQEDWQDVPEGSPQTPLYRWWRLHDEYAKEDRK